MLTKLKIEIGVGILKTWNPSNAISYSTNHILSILSISQSGIKVGHNNIPDTHKQVIKNSAIFYILFISTWFRTYSS